jgi:hypothetical protein
MNQFMNITTTIPAAGLRVRTQVHAGVLTFSGDENVATVVTKFKEMGWINVDEPQNNLISLTAAGQAQFSPFLV